MFLLVLTKKKIISCIDRYLGMSLLTEKPIKAILNIIKSMPKYLNCSYQLVTNNRISLLAYKQTRRESVLMPKHGMF